MIYIVEDDASIRELEQYALQSNGYEVQGFESRIRFLLKFMNSLKRIKIRKMENKPHSIKETETEFRIL